MTQPPHQQGNLTNDPFLTHARPAQGAKEKAKMVHSLSRDPFGTRIGQENVPLDPLLAKSYGAAGKASQLKGKFRAGIEDAWETFIWALGPGDYNRTLLAREAIVGGPILVFTLMMLSGCILRHWRAEVHYGFSFLVVVYCAALYAFGFQKDGKTPYGIPTKPLGGCLLLAAIVGFIVANAGWDQEWRQIWWSYTGRDADRTTASSAAYSSSDAALINFWNGPSKLERMNYTSVDTTRAAAYKDGHFYCVAPVMSPETASGASGLVNYWAIGIDCCQLSGSFHCDQSRLEDAGYGLVMLNGGFPCPGCNNDKFRAAVRKAEAEHELVSAQDAIFVRWTNQPKHLKFEQLMGGINFIVLSIVISAFFFFLVGSLLWYYGVGNENARFDPPPPARQSDAQTRRDEEGAFATSWGPHPQTTQSAPAASATNAYGTSSGVHRRHGDACC
eukprot:TRINITY_DN7045_c0_g1_i1.p1 TRINITY_DN7045_c0_g1~~TRINITY_DN7045_c0_g1_i1.p1  ORF type:complete len:445 (+),score=64.89 TRINITY_DN7045_c0_g1_i1:193-1527(+)